MSGDRQKEFFQRGEYDGYELPELLKEETPETRAKKQAAIEELNAFIESNR